MITPQTKSRIANFYQNSLANKSGDVLSLSQEEPTGMLEVPATGGGMLEGAAAPAPTVTQAAAQTSAATPPAAQPAQQPIASQPQPTTTDPNFNYNANGKPMTFKESLDFEGEQKPYDDSQSALWNQLHGRWRRTTEPLKGAIKPMGQGESAFTQQLVATGKIPAPVPAATGGGAAPPDTSGETGGTNQTGGGTGSVGTTQTPATNTSTNPALIAAITKFKQETGLLGNSTPEEIAGALSKVTPAEYNSLSPTQKEKAKELFALAGLPVPGGSETATGTTNNPALITAITKFKQETGLLGNSTPEEIAAALGKVTAAEYNSLSASQKTKARELFLLAGLPVPGEGTTGTGGTGTTPTAATLNLDELTRRTLRPNETTAGQIEGMMEGPIAEAARERAKRAANDRGMLNSTMAVQAGEAAALEAVQRIASEDAAAQRGAGDYNAALENQARMYNTDQNNALLLKQLGIEADFKMQDRSILAQLDIEKLRDATARWEAEKRDETSRYNTDQDYKRTMDQTRMQIANNIAVSSDIPPARRAEMLRAWGFPDLANAIYVVTDVGDELGAGGINGGGGGNDTQSA